MQANILRLSTLITNPLAVAGGLLLAGVLLTHLAFHRAPFKRFLCQLVTFAGFTMMLVLAKVVPFRPTPAMDLTLVYVLVSSFKIVWWLGAAWLIAGFVRAALIFKRQPVETRFLQDVFTGISYIGAVLGIIAYVFNTPVQGLLAASGVMAIVIGLALQSTLGDLFSGVVLNMAKPYHPGDWVILDGGLEGRIIETNWRATRIQTLNHDIALVPNSVIAKGRLINASQPTEAHGVKVTIRLDPTSPPAASVAVLEAALLSCNHILRAPLPVVAIRGLDAVAVECELTFFVSPVEQGPMAQNEVFDRIYRFCLSAGIRLAPPEASGQALPIRLPPLEAGAVPRRMLDRLAVFSSLSDDQRAQLVPKMQRHVFKAGEILLEQGAVSPFFCILHSGVLAASQLQGKTAVEIFRLAPGDCFAQASIVTGAPSLFKVRALTASVVYEIPREEMAPILADRPAIAAELHQITDRREAQGRLALAGLDAARAPPDTLAARIAGGLKLIFTQS